MSLVRAETNVGGNIIPQREAAKAHYPTNDGTPTSAGALKPVTSMKGVAGENIPSPQPKTTQVESGKTTAAQLADQRRAAERQKRLKAAQIKDLRSRNIH